MTDEIFGYRFARPAFLAEALTHRSAARPRQRKGREPAIPSNERLEFMGDRVLGLIVAEWLVERFPAEPEGALARRHAHLVARPMLATIGERLGLADRLSVAPNEARAGVRLLATVLADAMEAVIGAIYLDGGLDPARHLVRAAWLPAMEAQITPPKDPKTALQEWLGARGKPLPVYTTERQDGPPHNPVFTVAVTGNGRTGRGSAGSKQVAERDAAADLLGQLEPEP